MPKKLEEIKELTKRLRENPGDPIKVNEYTLALEEAYQELHAAHDGHVTKVTELTSKYHEAVELNGKLTLRVSQPAPEPVKEDEVKQVKWSEMDI